MEEYERNVDIHSHLHPHCTQNGVTRSGSYCITDIHQEKPYFTKKKLTVLEINAWILFSESFLYKDACYSCELHHEW